MRRPAERGHLPRIVHRSNAQPRALLGAQHLPRNNVRMVLQPGNDDLIGQELERENTKLKRLVAELSLEKQILKDVASGNF
jgi:hypothetical protein